MSTVLVGSDAVDLSILQDLQELLSQQIHSKASLFYSPSELSCLKSDAVMLHLLDHGQQSIGASGAQMGVQTNALNEPQVCASYYFWR